MWRWLNDHVFWVVIPLGIVLGLWGVMELAQALGLLESSCSVYDCGNGP